MSPREWLEQTAEQLRELHELDVARVQDAKLVLAQRRGYLQALLEGAGRTTAMRQIMSELFRRGGEGAAYLPPVVPRWNLSRSSAVLAGDPDI